MDFNTVLTDIRRGQLTSYGKIIELYQSSVTRYLLRISGDRATAEKLARDTFTSVYWLLYRNDPESLISELIYKTATEKWRATFPKPARRFGWFRRKKNKPSAHLLKPLLTFNGDISAALLALPPEYRTAVALHFIEGFGYGVVARVTGATEESITRSIFEVKLGFLNKSVATAPECISIEPLLSAYADREITPDEKSRVENHIKRCSGCRQTLREFEGLRERIAALWVTPASPDIKEEVLSVIRETPPPPPPAPPRPRRVLKLRTAYVNVTLLSVILLLLLLLSTDTTLPVNRILSRTRTAITEINTFVDISSQPERKYGYTFEYAGPTLHHTKAFGIASYGYELTVIADEIYFYTEQIPTSGFPLSEVSQTNYYRALIPPYFIELIRVSDGVVDGRDCFHLVGYFDMEKYIAELREHYQGQPATLINMLVSGYTGQQIKQEIWISKSDYLIRKTTQTRETKYGVYTSSENTFSRLNAPMSILPPLSGTGELLPGWTHYRKQGGQFIQITP